MRATIHPIISMLTHNQSQAMEVEHNRETLDRLLDELDAKGREQHPGECAHEYWVCQRRHPRHAFRTDCRVRFLSPTGSDVLCLVGRTRNLSRGGIGVLVRHVFLLGDPIEVEISLPDKPVMFMAGVVQFVRYAGRGYHELGVALKAAGTSPVFSHDVTTAAQTFDWVKRAVYASKTC